MTAAIPELTTPRLILRPLVLADSDAVQRLFPRIEVVRFLASRVPMAYPADGAFTFLRDVVLPGMERGTEWHWSIRLKSAPEQLIGMINVRDSGDDNRGFWLDPAWHGQGLMTEASDAVTDFWFDTLQRPVPARHQGHRQHRFAPDFGNVRHARDRHRGSRLRLRPLALGNLGNDRRGMAQPPSAPIIAAQRLI